MILSTLVEREAMFQEEGRHFRSIYVESLIPRTNAKDIEELGEWNGALTGGSMGETDSYGSV